jgi:rare lipoprotein A
MLNKQLIFAWMALLFLGGCVDNHPVVGTYPKAGIASWYSDKMTTIGERSDGKYLTCAMRKTDFGKRYKVCNIANNKCVVVRHNDFGPSRDSYDKGRIIDLTRTAFSRIADPKEGLVNVTLEEISDIPPTDLGSKYQGEKIVYAVRPLGESEYNDLGIVDFEGKKLWLVTFHTKVIGFDDLEKIYADPATGLPLKVERYIKWPFSKEFLTEEYGQDNSLVISRFVKDKFTNDYRYKSNGPYHNAVLLPFYLRQIENFDIGWSMVVRLPDEFSVILESIEDVKVRGKTVTAYHFISAPRKFEIWISKDEYRLPVIIKGVSGYSMIIKSDSNRGKNESNNKGFGIS